eukprot:CAMPEP_0113489946 /NCGR_PEP_ID=MMETSP0014_2-20120614/26789_1 /TAXON_ID=2857 /ORGANISM="Nitzschia sp." /LENGTH=390 /DNA_ID=CAMNT_0000383695 /DNA_START=68 /DNA_END=1240 /DNA_ORIENTATION=- /assembly_acc=CAM_ASM_000159
MSPSLGVQKLKQLQQQQRQLSHRHLLSSSSSSSKKRSSLHMVSPYPNRRQSTMVVKMTLLVLLVLYVIRVVESFSVTGINIGQRSYRPTRSHGSSSLLSLSLPPFHGRTRSFLKLSASNEDDDEGDGTPPLSSKSTTDLKPLYDGTGYTFPDTSTQEGLAEVLECTFVNACLQLSQGYVDVLKLFIAGCIACYERQFSVIDMNDSLTKCDLEIQTANRPLMEEETKLRFQWLCVVYLTLDSMGHSNSDANGTGDDGKERTDSIPEDVRDMYAPYVSIVGDKYKEIIKTKGGSMSSYFQDSPISVEDLIKQKKESEEGDKATASMTPIEEAILLQSLRVATLTPVVVSESSASKEVMESSSSSSSKGSSKGSGEVDDEIMPPTPPIEGAFQ